ncbi:hypothetical protein FB45DRAFT_859251 [Roridomyces roridus]|uniref:Uncharacterized protein n=1 Tax=Roridomyces roridus TaxID=1738132 RepID=A0AAD7G182_9AGAR|nr:hypothetical protein FB45DRAFT_859251 [Roridomyces roridus]
MRAGVRGACEPGLQVEMSCIDPAGSSPETSEFLPAALSELSGSAERKTMSLRTGTTNWDRTKRSPQVAKDEAHFRLQRVGKRVRGKMLALTGAGVVPPYEGT